MDTISFLQQQIDLHKQVLSLYEDGSKEKFEFELEYLERMLESLQKSTQLEKVDMPAEKVPVVTDSENGNQPDREKFINSFLSKQ